MNTPVVRETARSFDRRITGACIWLLSCVPAGMAFIQEGYGRQALGGAEAPLSLHLLLLLPAFLGAATITAHLVSIRLLRQPRPEGAPGPSSGARLRWALLPLLLLNLFLFSRQVLWAMAVDQLQADAPWENAVRATGGIWTSTPAAIRRQADGSYLITVKYHHEFQGFLSGKLYLMRKSCQLMLSVPGFEGAHPMALVSDLPEGRLRKDFSVTYRLGAIPLKVLQAGRPVADVGLMAVGMNGGGELVTDQGMGGGALDFSRMETEKPKTAKP